MARIRSIKPEFWQNDRLSELPIEAHYLAAALLNYSDDFGYFHANAGLIRAACCPLREKFGNIPELLRSLQTVGYLRLAEGTDGRLYGWIVNFSEHQKVSHPTPSKIAGLADFPETFGSPPENPGEILPGTGNREQGTGKGNTPSKNRRGSSSGFDVFYGAYPRKQGRAEAEKAWAKLQPDDEMQALMLAALEKAKASEDWRRDGGKFIPHPSTWLNQRRWEDEYEPPLKPSNGTDAAATSGPPDLAAVAARLQGIKAGNYDSETDKRFVLRGLIAHGRSEDAKRWADQWMIAL